MPATAVWVLVGLAAILVGIAVPVLLELRRTLRVAAETLESTGKRVDVALGELTETLDRINRASAEIERRMSGLTPVLDEIGAIAETLGKLRRSVGSVASIGASLGTMVVGIARAAFGWRRDEPEDEQGAARDDVPSREEVSR